MGYKVASPSRLDACTQLHAASLEVTDLQPLLVDRLPPLPLVLQEPAASGHGEVRVPLPFPSLVDFG